MNDRIETLRWALQRAYDYLESANNTAGMEEVVKILIKNNQLEDIPDKAVE